MNHKPPAGQDDGVVTRSGAWNAQFAQSFRFSPMKFSMLRVSS